jgi:hypothetical protein
MVTVAETGVVEPVGIVTEAGETVMVKPAPKAFVVLL